MSHVLLVGNHQSGEASDRPVVAGFQPGNKNIIELITYMQFDLWPSFLPNSVYGASVYTLYVTFNFITAIFFQGSNTGLRIVKQYRERHSFIALFSYSAVADTFRSSSALLELQVVRETMFSQGCAHCCQGLVF